MIIKKRHLYKAGKINPDGIYRLAKFLNLRITGMSLGQIARLIYWRITRKSVWTKRRLGFNE